MCFNSFFLSQSSVQAGRLLFQHSVLILQPDAVLVSFSQALKTCKKNKKLILGKLSQTYGGLEDLSVCNGCFKRKPLKAILDSVFVS